MGLKERARRSWARTNDVFDYGAAMLFAWVFWIAPGFGCVCVQVGWTDSNDDERSITAHGFFCECNNVKS